MKYILALDQGTTSSRAILFDSRGRPVSVAQQEFEQIYPSSGWVEHDPIQIWQTQLHCARRALSEAGVRPEDVAGIGVTNQRETTVIWDRKTGEPIHHAIVWQDRRTAPACVALHARGVEVVVREKTGLRLDPYFAATKIAWILDHEPGARERAEKGELAFGTIDSWLIWNLTAGQLHVTDVTNASRTLLFNLATMEWDEELLAIMGVPASLLPQVVASSGVMGRSCPELFGTAIPIAGIAGDQQAAAFGQACFDVGMAKNTYGTGGFLLLNVGRKVRHSANRLLATVGWQRAGESPYYAIEGSVFVAGAVVQWLRDGLQLFAQSHEVEQLALEVPDNGGVFMVPAFVGLGAPHWDPQARGMIIGLNRASSRAHIARAALESIAFQCAEVFSAMERDTGTALRELRVDGGASRNDLLMQFQADISGVPVVRSAVAETTALGAAYLAGLAVGVWDDYEQIKSLWCIERRFEPKMSKDHREFLMTQWNRAVGRTRGWEQT